MVESLYSMDGDVAPLREIARLARRFGAFLAVDEAHAIGVLGPGGRGLATRLLGRGIDLVLGTFGKALGSYGAFVLATKEMKELLLNRARSFIFSTAPPPPSAAAALAALRLLPGLGKERARLLSLSKRLKERLEGLKGPERARAQIVPVILGEERAALRAAEVLEEAGFFVRAIRPPTVPEGTSRLRISLTAPLGEEEVDRLGEALRRALQAD